MNMHAYSGLSRLLLADTIWPAAEDTLSDGTEVAGTIAYRKASWASSFSDASADLQYVRAFKFHFGGFWQYWVTIAIAEEVGVAAERQVWTLFLATSSKLDVGSGTASSSGSSSAWRWLREISVRSSPSTGAGRRRSAPRLGSHTFWSWDPERCSPESPCSARTDEADPWRRLSAWPGEDASLLCKCWWLRRASPPARKPGESRGLQSGIARLKGRPSRFWTAAGEFGSPLKSIFRWVQRIIFGLECEQRPRAFAYNTFSLTLSIQSIRNRGVWALLMLKLGKWLIY